MKRFKKYFWMIFDWIWPTLEPFSEDDIRQQQKKLDKRIASYKDRIQALISLEEEKQKEVLIGCREFFEQQTSSRASIESRLQSILASSSIIAILSLGILSIFGQSHFPGLHWSIRALVYITSVYTIAQLLRAILAAIQGLSRQSFTSMTEAAYLPDESENFKRFIIEKMKKYIESAIDHEDKNNKKVEQLALAHIAFRNFIWGAFVTFFLLLIITLIPVNTESKDLHPIKQDERKNTVICSEDDSLADPEPQVPETHIDIQSASKEIMPVEEECDSAQERE